MKDGKFQIALIGCGYAGFLHCNAYSHVGRIGFDLNTVCDIVKEKADRFCKEYKFTKACYDFQEVIDDPEIDIIDIAVPPYLHTSMIKAGLEAGKHVFSEKPLTGYFGREGDPTPIGDKVAKKTMYDCVLKEMDELRSTIEEAEAKGIHFYFSENFVHAAPIQKIASVVDAKNSKILMMKATFLLKGSSSDLAGRWDATGGGCWIRNGVHSLAGILYLKQREAKNRGENIYPVAVTADMGRTSTILTEEEHRHISARPQDVEDNSNVAITFSDGTKANILISDTAMGGSQVSLDVYCNDGTMEARLASTDILQTYFLDEDGIKDMNLAEMLPTKMGWNNAFIADDMIRGHACELQAFLEAIAENRADESDYDLACLITKVLYGAYVAAEEKKQFVF